MLPQNLSQGWRCILVDTVGYLLAYLVMMPVYTTKFAYFFTKRTWCVAFHRNQYIKTGSSKAYCDKCKWMIEPWGWSSEV